MSRKTKKLLEKQRNLPNIFTSEISATSSITINLGNYNSGKIETSITKTITNPASLNMESEKAKLWEEVNKETDEQANELKVSWTRTVK